MAIVLAQTPSTHSEKPDLATVSSKINGYRSKVFDEARTSGRPVDRADLNAKVGAYASTLLEGVDIEAIPSQESSDWAQIFEQAGKLDQATKLEGESLGYHSTQLMFTCCDLVPKELRAGKDQEVLYLLRHAPDYSPRQLGMVGEVFVNNCQRLGFDKSKPQFVEQGIRILLGKLDDSPHEINAEKNSMGDNVFVGLMLDLFKMKYSLSKDPKILADLRALRSKFAASKSIDAFGHSPSHQIDEYMGQISMIGRSAPALVFQRTIGSFAGLEQLKGDVVLLDFMAHWCGPCKAAFPGIRKLQRRFGSSLQIVSISSFYGYYGTRQGLSEQDEFDCMHTFVKEMGIAWPVTFDEKQVSQGRYGVSAIPYMVILDKKGIVRSIQVGHTPEGEVATERLIEKLAAESK